MRPAPSLARSHPAHSPLCHFGVPKRSRVFLARSYSVANSPKKLLDNADGSQESATEC